MNASKLSKVILAAVLCILFQTQSFSQTQTHEIGLRTNNFENFSLMYKKEKQPNVFKRYRVAFGNFRFFNQEESNSFEMNLGAAIGREKRINIQKKLQFLHGPEFFAGFSATANNSIFNSNLNLQVGYALGFQHNFNENLAVNIEAIPSIGALLGINNGGVSQCIYSECQL